MNGLTHSEPHWIQFEERALKNGLLGLVHLNRVEQLNALSLGMIQALQQKLNEWAERPEVLAVWIDSHSEKAFCAGGDIRIIHEAVQQGIHPIEFFYHEYRLNNTIHEYPKPYIAYLNGLTMGGGVGLSVHASHRIGTEKLIWAMPETGIGFFPDVGGTYVLSRCPGKTGHFLGLTGQSLTAADAFEWGLLDSVIPSQRSADSLLEQLAELNFKASNADGKITSWLQKEHTHDLVASSQAGFNVHRVDIDKYFSHATIEEILDALTRADISPWATQTRHILSQRSPTSLKVTLAALKAALHLSFQDCLRMEYRLTSYFLTQPDFIEGIRAQVIDKDKKPNWNPAQLQEILPSQINVCFAQENDPQEDLFEVPI